MDGDADMGPESKPDLAFLASLDTTKVSLVKRLLDWDVDGGKHARYIRVWVSSS
jgi:hypothetical protein